MSNPATSISNDASPVRSILKWIGLLIIIPVSGMIIYFASKYEKVIDYELISCEWYSVESIKVNGVTEYQSYEKTFIVVKVVLKNTSINDTLIVFNTDFVLDYDRSNEIPYYGFIISEDGSQKTSIELLPDEQFEFEVVFKVNRQRDTSIYIRKQLHLFNGKSSQTIDLNEI